MPRPLTVHPCVAFTAHQVENPFLEPYYKEPKKYALPMQLWLLKQRFVTYVKAVKYCMHNADETRGVILDRSVRVSRSCRHALMHTLTGAHRPTDLERHRVC